MISRVPSGGWYLCWIGSAACGHDLTGAAMNCLDQLFTLLDKAGHSILIKESSVCATQISSHFSPAFLPLPCTLHLTTVYI